MHSIIPVKYLASVMRGSLQTTCHSKWKYFS